MGISVRVSVTVPESIINSAVLRGRIERVMKDRTGPEMRRLFKGTVAGWKHPPNFTQRFASTGDEISVAVFASGTNKNQYALVNYGSKKHTITPRRGGMLRFQQGYNAGTKPGSLSSRAPRRSGSFVSRKIVHHPGFKAREFDASVAEKILPKFIDDVNSAIKYVTKT